MAGSIQIRLYNTDDIPILEKGADNVESVVRWRAEMAAWAVVLRAMQPGGARGPCPAGLTSVEHRSKRGGFSRASTCAPLQAAAHGFSTDASGVGWMVPEHEQRWQRGLSCCVPCGVEALMGHARPA